MFCWKETIDLLTSWSHIFHNLVALVILPHQNMLCLVCIHARTFDLAMFCLPALFYSSNCSKLSLFTRLTNLIWFSDLIFSTVCPYCQFASNEIWSVPTGKQISGLSTSVSLVVIYASTRCLDTFSYKTVSLEMLLLFMSIMIILWCWTPRHMREHKHQRYCTHIGVVKGSSIGGPRGPREKCLARANIK